MRKIPLLLMLLAQIAAAEEGRQVVLNLQYPCRLSYVLDEDKKSVPLPPGTVGSNYLTLPRKALTLWAEGGSGLYQWQGSTHLYNIETAVELQLSRHINWLPLGVVGLLAVGIGWKTMRRRLETANRNVLEENLPLVPQDGSLPTRPIGGYRITRRLGAGGMGVVYQGVGADGAQVAIKVPAPHLIAEQEYRSRWIREIDLGTKLNHPGVVRMVCLPEGEELYLVLEFVEGVTLDNVAAKSFQQELKRVRSWLEQSLEALVYVHSQGVIHRDLKPANLIIQPNERLKMMDFGIAHKILGTKLTATDMILGTPVYMAPEQVQGLPVDERSDLYSLGLIFYERLLGKLPYPEDMLQIMQYKLTQSLPDLRQVLPGIPEGMANLLHWMTDRDPSRRPATANDALKALREFA
ncbi:MAG: serine/threonine protein kinase [Candidatus Eremiobacteraeota bacterium]|nr:serine/threonine protein kinase [Candidatus Eremiobacteraeota bacterium]